MHIYIYIRYTYYTRYFFNTLPLQDASKISPVKFTISTGTIFILEIKCSIWVMLRHYQESFLASLSFLSTTTSQHLFKQSAGELKINFFASTFFG